MSKRLEETRKLAKKEAIKLRQFAKKEEINNLDIESFRPVGLEGCIYGQMTGDCYSKRASHLITKCCERVYSSSGAVNPRNKLNGEPFHIATGRNNHYHSPIEVLLSYEKTGKTDGKKIIKFLKGETKTLKF